MKSIPVAQPIEIHEQIIKATLTQALIPTQEPTFQICKTCCQLFHRNEEDKMTSHYFRCKNCIKKQVPRGILASCILQ